MDTNREQLELELHKLINEVDGQSKKQTVKVYIRFMLDTDFNIHLLHDSKKVENNGSPLGLRIASALKEIGFVNHHIWIEMHSK
jgi:hypothetical protein